MKNPVNPEPEQPAGRAKQTLELVSFLIHEFKTPLTSIITSSNLLAEKLALCSNDPKTTLLNNILTSAYNLEVQTSQLLDLAKLEVEGFRLELKPTDINTIAYSAVDRLSATIHSRDQSLILNLTPNLPKIIADPLRTEQIMLNLLSNASNFTPQGNSIVLATNKQSGHIVVEIRDSGPSIPLEEQHKVFQPQYHLKSDKAYAPGIGLGLALCKHLVEIHGGKIWMETEQSKGNTFAFSMSSENSQ